MSERINSFHGTYYRPDVGEEVRGLLDRLDELEKAGKPAELFLATPQGYKTTSIKTRFYGGRLWLLHNDTEDKKYYNLCARLTSKTINDTHNGHHGVVFILHTAASVLDVARMGEIPGSMRKFVETADPFLKQRVADAVRKENDTNPNKWLQELEEFMVNGVPGETKRWSGIKFPNLRETIEPMLSENTIYSWEMDIGNLTVSILTEGQLAQKKRIV